MFPGFYTKMCQQRFKAGGFYWFLGLTFCLLSMSSGGYSAPKNDEGTNRISGFLSDSFVQRNQDKLTLEGRDFYFSGTNQYYLFYKSPKMVDAVLEDAQKLGVTVMRTWAFCDGQWQDGTSLQPNPRQYYEEGFRKLDYVIYKAKQLGIRVILPLVNNWDDFGGMNRYVRWSRTAREHDDFYSDEETRALFRDYINYLLWRTNSYTGIRYKDEPAIFAWELANEPRVRPQRADAFYAWVDEMASYIKSIDGNHLVSTGSEGDEGSDFIKTHSSPSVDISSFHLYPETWGMDLPRSISYLQSHILRSHQILKKPVYAGEFGLRDRSQRDSVYQRWYQEFDRLSTDGAMFWLLSSRQDDGSLYPDYDGFTVYYPDSQGTIAIIQDYNGKVKTKSGLNIQ